MTHLKRKLMMTLALLITAVGGAWAESKPIGLNVEYEVGDVITSTTDVYVYYGEQPSTSKQMAVKITSTEPLTIVEIYAKSFAIEGEGPMYYMPSGESTGGWAWAIPCLGESTGDATVVHVASGSGTLADPYVFGSGPAATSGTPVPLNWDATAKTATLTNGMPAGNVTVSVDYFAQAEFAMSTDATPVALAPAAIAGVKATTDEPIVKAGTVADIPGTSPAVKQGTLMYHVSTTALTDAELLALTADKWSADVPTAAKLAEGDAYVYYYIQGAEPTEGERSDANTCSDGDISAANVVNVTLAAAPLWNTEFDLTNAPEEDKAPGVWSTDIPEGGVVKGTPVTVTYSGTKKIIGVKAEKKKVLVTSITLNQTGNITRSNGDSGTLSVTSVLPEDATDKTYTWSSSDPYAVSIDQNGNWRVVGRSGNANLRATANDGSGVYAQITVWVR